ncbi:MAG: inorganic diphosphatase [Methyloceanibacter sp.]|uniref:inorganic diphosphatase n=1 Tax=Methyloceanibacter sp. TaxID=1965321 RepID=UPI003D6CDEEE
MKKNYALGAAVSAMMFAAGPSLAEYMNPIDFPQKGDPNDVQVVVEIPAGTFTKYELDAKTGLIFVDRFQSMPVVYPTNYGSIPSTVGPDGDPLDALVITRQPIYPGALIRVRPIGILKMIDGGEVDDKIVAVPISKVDPTYDNIKTVDDLPEIERARIEQFFAVYKKLPDGRKVVEMNGYDGVNAAVDMLTSGLEKFKTTDVSTSAQ